MVPIYEAVENDRRYVIVTISFIANGGDGYTFDDTAVKTYTGTELLHATRCGRLQKRPLGAAIFSSGVCGERAAPAQIR